MSALVPVGYLSRREAIDIIVHSLFSSLPDRPELTELREKGIDAADGGAIDVANAELWRGVDRSKIEVLACGANGQFFRMDVGLTEQVPYLRNPRGGGFTFSRPGTSAHDKLVAQFGTNLGGISLVFLRIDVEKWARSLLRKRRRHASAVGKRQIGRPGRQVLALPVICKLIGEKEWNATMSLKMLAQKVNRRVDADKPISEATVTRALDKLYEETGHRQFQRIVRKVA